MQQAHTRVFTGDTHLQTGRVLNVYTQPGTNDYVYTLIKFVVFGEGNLLECLHTKIIAHIFSDTCRCVSHVCETSVKCVKNTCDTRVIVKLPLSCTVYTKTY